LAEVLIRCSGSGSLRVVPFPEEIKSIDIGDYYGSYKKINSDLQWEPKISIEVGLRRTLDYYKKNLHYYM
jgi:UDP-glucose 4-epimerase